MDLDQFASPCPWGPRVRGFNCAARAGIVFSHACHNGESSAGSNGNSRDADDGWDGDDSKTKRTDEDRSGEGDGDALDGAGLCAARNGCLPASTHPEVCVQPTHCEAGLCDEGEERISRDCMWHA